MIRTTAALALALAIYASASAQVIIRTGRPVLRPPQPAGVIQSPMLPLPGSPLQHSTTAPRTVIPRGNIYGDPYYLLGGYVPYWPGWYETAPTTVVNNYIPVPTSVPPTVPQQAPAEIRARLTLNVPAGAKVLLAGKEVDAAIRPLILESPVLREGQSYTFDVKISWIEGRTTEERARKVTVDAGDSKSLTYLGSR